MNQDGQQICPRPVKTDLITARQGMLSNKLKRTYLLAVLTLIFAANLLDRIALGLLLEDIKVDLSLTDTELGLLTGIAFAIFYSVMGIPIARWADRGNRVTIISITALAWSVMVMLTATATSFAQLLLFRIGVGVGEAGAVPPAQSLIADSFPRQERPRAAAIYALGGPISLLVGYSAAGWLNDMYGWRVTLGLVGVPGIALGLLAWFTLREPRAQSFNASAEESLSLPAISVKAVVRRLSSNHTFRHLLIAFCLVYFFGYGLQQWIPAFFIRSHGLSTGELGVLLAVASGLGSLAGILLGGEWASRYAASNERLQLRVMGIAILGSGLVSALVFATSNLSVALILLALGSALGGSIYGPLYATVQSIIPPQLRAMAIAIVLLVANLIGMGFGPLVVGAISDLLEPYWHQESLRVAMIATCPGYIWCLVHFFLASNSADASIAAVEAEVTQSQ